MAQPIMIPITVDWEKVWEKIKVRLEKMDVVEVIRCKDCEWSEWYTSADGKAYCWCTKTKASARTEEDFCSYAERKES